MVQPGHPFQSAGEAQRAVDAFGHAVASRHPEYAPKAAINLGFVAFQDLGDRARAREAFRTAMTFGNPEQSALAQQNLLALDQIGRDRRSGITHAMTDDGVDVSRPSATGTKFRWFTRKAK